MLHLRSSKMSAKAGVHYMQHFLTSLRQAPPHPYASGLDWPSIPEITCFTYPDDFARSMHREDKQVLVLKETVYLVSEWAITRADALVRLKYAQSGYQPLWESAIDYSDVLRSESQDTPFVYTYVVPISVLWYVNDGRYDVQIDHILPGDDVSDVGSTHFTLAKRE